MEIITFQRIKVVAGKNNSRFPYCTALLIDGGDLLAVVDPGAGAEALQEALGDGRVELVINTHCHFDHINGNHLFHGAGVLLNPLEAACFPDLARVGEQLGIQEYYGKRCRRLDRRRKKSTLETDPFFAQPPSPVVAFHAHFRRGICL